MAIPYPGTRISVADNGDIYFIADSWTYGKISNGNISYFKPASMSPGSLAASIAFKLYGNYMYRGMGNSVNVIDLTTQTEVKRYTVTGGDEIGGMAVDPYGNIFTLSRNGQFSKINTSTDVVTSLVPASANSNYDLWIVNADMAADSSGNVYMVKNEAQIVKINAGSYNRTTYISSPTGSQLAGIAMHPNGTIYVTDQKLFKIYRVKIASSNNYLDSLSVSTGTLSPEFSRNTISYSVTVPYSTDKISVTPVAEDASAKVYSRLSPAAYVQIANGSASPEYDLIVGTNIINVMVTAENNSSRQLSISVIRQGVPPPAPLNLVASPGANGVELNWEPASGATKYKLFRGTSPDDLTLMSAMPVTGTIYFDNTAMAGTTYYYTIVAMEPNGAESPHSTAVTGMPNTPPAITDLIISGIFRVGEVLTAEYAYTDFENHDDASSFQWYRANMPDGTGNIAIPGATQNSYTLTTEDFGKFISVTVNPYDGISHSSAVASTRSVVLEASLPVKLTQFTWQISQKTVILHWQTATEINSKYFAIERSTNGRQWETVGIENASGDSYSVIRYSYMDKSPAPGLSFYRLLIVDKDGSREYSDIIQVRNILTVKNGIRLYPVPAGSFINVENGQKDLMYVITDAEGRQVKRGRITKELEQIQVLNLKPGLYYFKAVGHKALKFAKQ